MIHIQRVSVGEDMVFLVTGGKAHIGALATAYMTTDRAIHVDVMSLPNHREAELAADLAHMASRTLNRTVAVLVGIHLNQPSKQDIEDILAEATSTMKLVLDQCEI